MPTKPFNPQGIEKAAQELAGVSRALGNERRLMILCKLVEWGEAAVNSLADAVGLSHRLSLSTWRRCEKRGS